MKKIILVFGLLLTFVVLFYLSCKAEQLQKQPAKDKKQAVPAATYDAAKTVPAAITGENDHTAIHEPLFHNRHASLRNNSSCASCHNQQLGCGDWPQAGHKGRL